MNVGYALGHREIVSKCDESSTSWLHATIPYPPTANHHSSVQSTVFGSVIWTCCYMPCR